MDDRTRTTPTDRISETDIAQERMGRNSLQGEDQAAVHNQRHAAPGVRREADGIVETAEAVDKDVRAERTLGKRPRARRRANDAGR